MLWLPELHAELINFNVKYFEIVSPNLNIFNTRMFGGGMENIFWNVDIGLVRLPNKNPT